MIDLKSGKMKLALGVVVILILGIAYIACGGEAKAADTIGPMRPKPVTKVAPIGDWYVPLTVSYTTDFGIGGGVAYQWRSSGVMLALQATYTETEGDSGTVSHRVGCRTYQVPWSTGDDGHAGVAVTVTLPIYARK